MHKKTHEDSTEGLFQLIFTYVIDIQRNPSKCARFGRCAIFSMSI